MNVFLLGGPDAVPAWLQIAEAVGQALGTISVFIAVLAFAIQWFRNRQERDQRAEDAKIDRQRHEAQLAAFRQAEDDRLAAQARRVLVTPLRATFVNPSIWNITINNWSVDAITLHNVEIMIIDPNGQLISGGWRLADRVKLGESMVDMFYPEFAKVMDPMIVKVEELFEAIRAGAVSVGEAEEPIRQLMENANFQINEQTATIMKEQVKYAMTINFTDEWPGAIAPSHYSAMAIHTTRPEYQVHVKLRYEDAFGYLWERTDTQGPKRVREIAAEG